MSRAAVASFALSPVERKVVDVYESLRQRSDPDVESVQFAAQGALNCPSVPVQRGGIAIAVRDGDGDDFKFLKETFPVSAGALGDCLATSVQVRLRVTGPCIRVACESWTSTGCRWGHAVASVGRNRSEVSESCPIRDNCRWFAENGESSCRACASLAY